MLKRSNDQQLLEIVFFQVIKYLLPQNDHEAASQEGGWDCKGGVILWKSAVG